MNSASRILLALCSLLAAGLATFAQGQGAAVEDTGPPRALSFQIHDPEQVRESRLALVIGNSDYRDAPLTNPTNDARAMSAKLSTLR